MKDKILIGIITYIDPQNKLVMNPIHLLLFMIVTAPALLIFWTIYPLTMRILLAIVSIQLFLFILKIFVKDKYKNEMEAVKKSIPTLGLMQGFNLFHLIMFSLIAAPFLFILYGIISAIK